MSESCKILWAEDEDLLREIMCELLQSEGYHCIPAENGLKARKLLEQMPFNILVADFNMPELGGAELLFWCRQNNCHLPVIFVTASVDRTPREELVLKDCCASLLTKPFSIEALLEAIAQAKMRNHEFHCKGKIIPLDRGDFQEDFPGRHLFD